MANIVEPTGALAGYIRLKRTARRLRRAAEEGRLERAAALATAMPRGLRAMLLAAVALMALLAVIGLGGTLVGWTAPSAAAHAVGAARGLLAALGLPGEAPWLPAARDMAAHWAERGAADRGIVFAAAADASAALSLALVPLMVLPLWASAAIHRFADCVPRDPDVLRRGRLVAAAAAAFMAFLVWHTALLLIYGDLGWEGASAGRFSASSFAPAEWALMALCCPGFAAALPSFVVRYVIRPPER